MAFANAETFVPGRKRPFCRVTRGWQRNLALRASIAIQQEIGPGRDLHPLAPKVGASQRIRSGAAGLSARQRPSLCDVLWTGRGSRRGRNGLRVATHREWDVVRTDNARIGRIEAVPTHRPAPARDENSPRELHYQAVPAGHPSCSSSATGSRHRRSCAGPCFCSPVIAVSDSHDHTASTSPP